MGSSQAIRAKDVEALLRVAGEAAELPSQPGLRRAHVLDRLLGIVGGRAATCFDLDPRPSRIGKPLPGTITHVGAMSEQDRRWVDSHLETLDPIDPVFPHYLAAEGPAVALRCEQMVDRDIWYRAEHFNEVRRPLGVGETLYAKVTLPGGGLLAMGIQREIGDPAFTDRDSALLNLFHSSAPQFYQLPPPAPAPTHSVTPPAVAFPDPAVQRLPPRLKPVLQHLLSGDAEKQVAVKLGLSRHTVHEYIKTLYRQLGVNSRGELLARFVSVNS